VKKIVFEFACVYFWFCESSSTVNAPATTDQGRAPRFLALDDHHKHLAHHVQIMSRPHGSASAQRPLARLFYQVRLLSNLFLKVRKYWLMLI
jgi:hypothetical protein